MLGILNNLLLIYFVIRKCIFKNTMIPIHIQYNALCVLKFLREVEDLSMDI